MPLTSKGKKIMASMKAKYGSRAKEVFYRSKNAGKIHGVDKGFYGHTSPSRMTNPGQIRTSVELC
jgi:hypothetical protein